MSATDNVFGKRHRLDREWMSSLKPTEYMVLSLVFDRTIGWGKPSERITIRDFVEGKRNATCGTSLSRRTVIAVLAALAKRGVLMRRGRDGNVYEINFAWEPEGAQPVPLAEADQPARGRHRCRPSTPEVQTAHSNSADAAPHKKKIEEEDLKEENDSASLRLRSREGGGGFAKKTPKVRDRPKPTSSFNPRELRSRWETAWRETFEGTTCPLWCPKERGQVRQLAQEQIAGGTLPTFLEWAVREWALIMNTRFTWMDRARPSFPSIGFMLGLKEKFFEAWNDRQTLCQELNMTAEQRLIRRYRRGGMGYEDAKVEADKMLERRQRHSCLEREREQNALEARALERERQQLRHRQQAMAAYQQPTAQWLVPVSEDDPLAEEFVFTPVPIATGEYEDEA